MGITLQINRGVVAGAREGVEGIGIYIHLVSKVVHIFSKMCAHRVLLKLAGWSVGTITTWKVCYECELLKLLFRENRMTFSNSI